MLRKDMMWIWCHKSISEIWKKRYDDVDDMDGDDDDNDDDGDDDDDYDDGDDVDEICKITFPFPNGWIS